MGDHLAKFQAAVANSIPGARPAPKANGAGDDGFRDAYTQLQMTSVNLIAELEQKNFESDFKLNTVTKELADATKSLTAQETKVVGLEKDLSDKEKEHKEALTTKTDELAAATKKAEDGEAKVKELEASVADLKKKLEDAEAELTKLKKTAEDDEAAKLGLEKGKGGAKGDPESPKENLSLETLKEKSKSGEQLTDAQKEDLRLGEILKESTRLKNKADKEGGRQNHQAYEEYYNKHENEIVRAQMRAE